MQYVALCWLECWSWLWKPWTWSMAIYPPGTQHVGKRTITDNLGGYDGDQRSTLECTAGNIREFRLAGDGNWQLFEGAWETENARTKRTWTSQCKYL